MLLFLLSFVGGILTIVSPCILPVLPFVFSRSDQPFRRSGLPLLAGMAATFAAVAALATYAGSWIVRANQLGRGIALVIFVILGFALLFPTFAEFLSRPFVRLGGKVTDTPGQPTSISKSLLLGVSTGLLWAPCAGPILGLILTGAAVQGPNAHTALLLLAFALGASCSLAAALLAGGKVFAMMKKSLGAEEWIRRAIGVAVLLAVLAIALGWDRGVLQQVSLASTSGIEQRLLDKVHPANSQDQPSEDSAAPSGPAMTSSAQQHGPSMMMMSKNGQGPAMNSSANQNAPAMMMMAKNGANNGGGGSGSGPAMAMAAKGAQNQPHTEGTFHGFNGAVGWLNSQPLTKESLAGKVVLVDFWTYSCINCLRSIPYIEAWWEKYKGDGLVVVGVHTPEFAFERDEGNIAKAVRDLKITYPVAIDSNYAIWKAFSNQYWPAHYFIDRQGKIRYHHFGEGDYDQSEQVLQALLAEGDHDVKGSGFVDVHASGAQAAPDSNDVQSPETYVGFDRQQNYASPQTIQQNDPADYTAPGRLDVNQWALGGKWIVGAERGILVSPPGKIVFRFHARDLHFVLGPGKDGKPIRFRVLLDGAAPGEDKGVDVDAAGNGTVKDYRLYQLIRQKGKVEDRTFQIEFLDPGVQAYAFTFG